MFRPPNRSEAITTGLVGIISLLAWGVAPVAASLEGLSWFLLEIIGRLLDRPTSLVVAGYVVSLLTALAYDLVPRPRPTKLLVPWLLCCSLAVLGQGYIVVLAWRLRPEMLVVSLVCVLALGLFWSRSSPALTDSSVLRLPVVTLFVLIHVLVEGSAGNILTPWLGSVAEGLAGLSVRFPLLYLVVAAAAVAGPLVLLSLTVRGGVSCFGWLHWDPRRLVEVLCLVSLTSLSVVSCHYLVSVLNCPPADGRDLQLLSSVGGVFDLEPSSDGRYLAVSHREAQSVEIIDLVGPAPPRFLGTALPTDTLFNRTEPETLLGLDDGSYILLVASSDSEQGNLLTLMDPEKGSLSLPLLARGVSDLVRDGGGGVWISSEFDGRLGRLDLRSGDTPEPLIFRGAETNKVIVEAASNQAWSAGLWTDTRLRLFDTELGVELAVADLGTHQWDLGLSPTDRRLYVPRLVEGRIHVFDADSLEPLTVFAADFGIRPIEIAPGGDLVVTGNVYTGDVVGRFGRTGEERFRHHIGGYIKGLRIDSEGRLYAGSICGTWQLSTSSQ